MAALPLDNLPFDILVITDRLSCAKAGRTVESTLAAMLKQPESDRVAVLLREKVLPQAGVAQMLRDILPIVRDSGAKLLIHSYPRLALEWGLEGVHLASQADIMSVRSQLLPEMLLGVSRHSFNTLDEADLSGADYATISPIYSPTSKPDDQRETLGALGLQSCIQRSVRPLVALGGIRPGRVRDVMDQGVAAIAVSGAVLQANDPAKVLKQLWDEINQHNPPK